MNWAVGFRSVIKYQTRFAAMALAVGLVAAGCGGGGGGGGGTGIRTTDEHGNSLLQATVIIPDGANASGQINYPTDRDWFRFRGIQGVGYVLQIHGFPPDPNVRPDLDLTGDSAGTRVLVPAIVDINGAEQLVNSAGAQGGVPYDIDPVGADNEEGFVIIGDSRVMWVCPNTNDYYFVIFHERELTGIGAYEVRLATSQFMTVESTDTIFQTGRRFVTLIDEQAGVYFDDWIAGGLQWTFLEYEEAITTREDGFLFAISDLVFLPSQTNPQPVVVHLHYGAPNNFIPEASDGVFDGDHPRFAEVQFDFARRRSDDTVVGEAIAQLPDGNTVRFPANAELVDAPEGTPEGWVQAKVTFDFDEIATDASRGIIPVSDWCCLGSSGFGLDDALVRSITGISAQWFMDLHPQPDVEDLDPAPIATSRPMGDTYQMFESHLLATPNNVVSRSGTESADRGFLPSFTVYYDASLKLFQVATQEYQVSGFYPYNPSFINPDYTAYVGDRIRVHRGGPGEEGPAIIDLGTLPSIAPPPTARAPFFEFTILEPEGVRAPIRQLTDAEATRLRDAYYTDGFYVEVTDSLTGEQLVRAEGFLEISFFPTLEPCSFPPCARSETPYDPTARGTANFATTTLDSGNITLYVNGQLIGQLDKALSPDDLPACGASGDGSTVAAELSPETYYWHAHAEDGRTWDGHVTTENGSCETILLE